MIIERHATNYKVFSYNHLGKRYCLFSSSASQKPVQKLLGVSETKNVSTPSRNDNKNKTNDIEETRLPEYRKYNTELLNIRIIQNGKVISVHHLPGEVIIRRISDVVEVYDEDGESLTETYHLVTKNLSWLDNTYAHSSEVLLDLHVNA
ncbi:hypothetical protein [Nitrosopumilus sp.]|uniref:hypothetical protein n=1 Tax=Nitrosopumilus sp. TaxID=2024843 RepID=UPI002930F506|nr:hypothetical protein [Nitrosopumilus sp.]